MKWLVALLIVAAAAVVELRSPMESSEARGVPSQYVRLGRTRPSRQIRLHFSLKYRNAETLHDEWTNRSNPKHAMYGQWLSLDELVARYAPSPDAISLVQSKLRAAGASSVVSSRLGHTEVTLSVAAAERLLGCVFHSFRNKKTGQVVHRALDGLYTLPRSLAAVVDHVEGVRRLPVIRAGGVRRSSKIGLLVTPKVIRERYQTTGISSVNANNSGGVAQFIGQHFTQSDLNEFYALYDKSNIGTKPIIVGPNSPPPGVEASLDIQYFSSVANHVKQLYFWVTPHTDPHPFHDFFAQLANATAVPLIFSISYGESEVGNSFSWLQQLNNEFMLVGMRGISVLFASGDSGVSADGNCPNSSFEPDWPATSPYVTAVGGTHLGFLETGSEKAWSGSGGGFSTMFSQPSWQASQVANYLSANAKSLPPSSYWNATGRAYPDVSAFSVGFAVVVDLVPTPVDGTSCATPTFSGVIALINDLKLNAGKPPLGPLNQWLYGLRAGTNDIVEGCNQGCLGQHGFCAAKGWDPVTGLGSPLYNKMKQQI